MDADKRNTFVVEWTIENFSCWNSELHDKVITSTTTCTRPEWWFELYPRGLSGQDEHLVVILHQSGPWRILGDLSIISSDGSLLCTQKVDSKEDVCLLELLPGPKFDEVVAQIRKKEALHKDRLTLRWRKSNPSEMVEYVCTTIHAFEFLFRTSSKVLDDLSSTYKILSIMEYLYDEEKMERMFLEYAEDRSDRSKIVLTLSLSPYQKNVSVLTRMSVLNNEDVVRTEENEHVFRNGNYWFFCNSLTREEMSKEVSLNLYLKITPSRKYRKGCCLIHNFQKIYLMPKSSFNPPGTSISEQRSSSSMTTGESYKTDNSLTALSSELMCLYQDQDFSDFQLKCENISFLAHRAILSARSPVFKTMLSTDMRESVSGSMDIEDLDPSTLGLFLTYLYTGAVDELQEERAIKLYYAADKYQVPSLKRNCVSVLCSSVSISNVCDILSLADKHHDDHLTSVAHEFFLRNYNGVLASEEWKSFLRSEPMLALETVTHFGEKKYVKISETSQKF